MVLRDGNRTGKVKQMEPQLAHICRELDHLDSAIPEFLQAPSRAEWDTGTSLPAGDDILNSLDRRYEIESGAVARVRQLLSEFPSDETVQSGAWPEEQRDLARRAIRRLARSFVVEVTHGLDFVMELRTTTLFRDEFPGVFFLLARMSSSEALERETHGGGMGYHFHYVDTRGDHYARSDVVLTYHPHEIESPDKLYWEHHSQGQFQANPEAWGKKRVRAAYDAARPSLKTPGKKHFRMPSATARVLARQ
jgi:hypothetical protein